MPAEEILYVGDRVDNDVVPALGPQACARSASAGARMRGSSRRDGIVTIGSLTELPEALDRV